MTAKKGAEKVKIGSVTYTGEWKLDGNMLTVTVPGLGTERNQLGGLSPGWLARDLIRKLVCK
ncbi:hypothetical protein KUL72_19870 [Bradyrhizobium arachidis]|uniref:hypothetical protein n=1 Tax=Bradyrhizobium arachidis TaxID=858423 RepID=UPI0021628156|nr:hypothetical protein [Bradyrhizobium arachidis]UVO33782.1 hypothetical protein KUL72_19870 [Bradyrhizobium arachidis]